MWLHVNIDSKVMSSVTVVVLGWVGFGCMVVEFRRIMTPYRSLDTTRFTHVDIGFCCCIWFRVMARQKRSPRQVFSYCTVRASGGKEK